MIAGQGTIGLELAEQVPDARDGADSRSAAAASPRASRRRCARVKPDVRIVGVQAGKTGFTIADGIFVKYPGELTMGILDSLLDDMVHVADEEITEAIVLLLERSKLVVEGAGAVGVAALLAGKAGRRRAGGRGPLRREHRPDAAHLGDAARPHRRRPLPRRAHAHPGPARAS